MKRMSRLFVAIRPPPDQRIWLKSLASPIIGARWQDDNQLHVTLRFIGDIDRHGARDVADALRRMRFSPLTMAVNGVGSFDRRGRVDTLWAGIQPRDRLTHLHDKIDRACLSTGLPAETRTYIPHITLARFGHSGGAIGSFVAQHAGLTGPPFRVDRFGLYESLLGGSGATYRVMEEYQAQPSNDDGQS
jgi:2'-5' RNA ligase